MKYTPMFWIVFATIVAIAAGFAWSIGLQPLVVAWIMWYLVFIANQRDV